MSMTTTAVSSTETLSGSGRAGNVTVRPRPDPVSTATFMARCWSESRAETSLRGEVPGEGELCDRAAVRRFFAGAVLLVQDVERAGPADHAGGVDAEALGHLQLIPYALPLDA